MTVLVLLGGPGSGKGTQAAVLSQRLELPHVATGDLFRAAVRDGSPIGLEARRYMERGQLVPDDITIRMLGARLAQVDAARGVILDGFPRNRAQAVSLDAHWPSRAAGWIVPLEIDVPTEILITRLSGRLVCQSAGHPYNEQTHRPRVAGHAATSTARRSSSARMTAPRPSGPGSRPSSARSARSCRTIARPGSCARSTAASRSTTSRPTSWRPSPTCSRRHSDGHPQVARRDREDAPRRPDHGRGPGPVRGGAQAGCLHGRARSSRRGAHPQVGRDPLVQGLPGDQPEATLPGQHLHLDR